MILRQRQVAALLAMIIFLYTHIYYGFRIVTYTDAVASVFVYPVLRIMHGVTLPIKRFTTWWQTTSQLERLLKEANNAVEALQAENIMLGGQLRYYKDIQELIVFKQRYSQKGVIAQILLKQFSSNGHYFLIDAGSVKNITQDMVAVYQNMLVGRVTEVYPFYSKVVLITDRLSRIPARCSKTGTCGVLEGINDLEATPLNFVSHLDEVHDDDLVLTSGHGLIFPAGYGLGRIKEICPDNFGLTLKVCVKPILDFHTIGVVHLVHKGECNAAQ